MPEVNDKISTDTMPLPTPARVAAGILGVAALAFGLWHSRTPVTLTEAAADCGDTAPCTVEVDQLAEGGIAIAVVALATLMLLMALTGRLFTVKFGDTSLTPEPQATVVPEKVVEEATAAGKVRSLIDVPMIRYGQQPELITIPPPSPQQMWAGLTPDVAATLERDWRSWYDESVVDKIIDVRKPATGNGPWFVEAKAPGGADRWIQVTPPQA